MKYNHLMELDANTQIRTFLTIKGSNITKLAKLLSERTGKKYTRQNLSNRLRAGTIRYDEMLVIANILGFKITIEEK